MLVATYAKTHFKALSIYITLYMIFSSAFINKLFQVQLVLLLLFFNFYSRFVSDLPTTITTLEDPEFNYIFIFTNEIYTFLYCLVTNQHPFVSVQIITFVIFCKAGLVMNFSLFLKNNFTQQSIFLWKFNFSFSTLNISCYSWFANFLLKNLMIILLGFLYK